MYENDGGLLSPRDAYRLMLKDYPDVMDIGQKIMNLVNSFIRAESIQRSSI